MPSGRYKSGLIGGWVEISAGVAEGDAVGSKVGISVGSGSVGRIAVGERIGAVGVLERVHDVVNTSNNISR